MKPVHRTNPAAAVVVLRKGASAAAAVAAATIKVAAVEVDTGATEIAVVVEAGIVSTNIDFILRYDCLNPAVAGFFYI